MSGESQTALSRLKNTTWGFLVWRRERVFKSPDSVYLIFLSPLKLSQPLDSEPERSLFGGGPHTGQI